MDPAIGKCRFWNAEISVCLCVVPAGFGSLKYPKLALDLSFIAFHGHRVYGGAKVSHGSGGKVLLRAD
ncbi:hypothetical protein [Kordiimonas lacus]|uniref:hypothetical protein n=1 Tax=Kordiimonas lacus TaxID=637679 RepID=UPI0011140633|nr:hypothetical protein [Kordiimonas lacus]